MGFVEEMLLDVVESWEAIERHLTYPSFMSPTAQQYALLRYVGFGTVGWVSGKTVGRGRWLTLK